MTEPPRPTGPPRGSRAARLLAPLLACAAVASAATLALDRYAQEQRQQHFTAGLSVPDPHSIPAPSVADWHAAPLVPGTPAPPFDLVDVRGGGRVSLGDFRGCRPVVLLLSSFGCNVFCGELGRLARLSESYEGRASFLFVAITDAGHPGPELSSPDGGARPKGSTREERLQLVREGLGVYPIPYPVLLDEGGEVERAYGAFPKRLVIVGADGLVVYDGGRGAAGGPSAWDLAEVERYLHSALGPESE
jgi:hypothetical protein